MSNSSTRCSSSLDPCKLNGFRRCEEDKGGRRNGEEGGNAEKRGAETRYRCGAQRRAKTGWCCIFRLPLASAAITVHSEDYLFTSDLLQCDNEYNLVSDLVSKLKPELCFTEGSAAIINSLSLSVSV